MKPWHTLVVLGFVVVGVAVIFGVANFLYGSFWPTVPEEAQTIDSGRDITFSCTDGTTLVALFERDEVLLTFSNGRMESVVWTSPAVIGENTGEQYVNSDGTLAFWHADSVALIQENGVFIHGECFRVER